MKNAKTAGWRDKHLYADSPVQVVTSKGAEIFPNLAAAQRKYPDLDPDKNTRRFTWAMKGKVRGRPAMRFEDWNTNDMMSRAASTDVGTLIRLAHILPEKSEERRAVLSLIAGCEKLPAGPMRENCEKKKEEGEKNDEKDSKKAVFQRNRRDSKVLAEVNDGGVDIQLRPAKPVPGMDVAQFLSNYADSGLPAKIEIWVRRGRGKWEMQKTRGTPVLEVDENGIDLYLAGGNVPSDVESALSYELNALWKKHSKKASIDNTLLRIAASLPAGDESRREILAGLKSAAFGVVQLEVESMENASKPYWVTGIGLDKYAVDERGIGNALKELVEQRVHREIGVTDLGTNLVSVEAAPPPLKVVHEAADKANHAGKAYVLYNTKSDRWAVK